MTWTNRKHQASFVVFGVSTAIYGAVGLWVGAAEWVALACLMLLFAESAWRDEVERRKLGVPDLRLTTLCKSVDGAE